MSCFSLNTFLSDAPSTARTIRKKGDIDLGKAFTADDDVIPVPKASTSAEASSMSPSVYEGWFQERLAQIEGNGHGALSLKVFQACQGMPERQDFTKRSSSQDQHTNLLHQVLGVNFQGSMYAFGTTQAKILLLAAAPNASVGFKCESSISTESFWGFILMHRC